MRSSRNEKPAKARGKSRSVQPECTKTPETAQTEREREPYKQEAGGSSPSPPTNKSTTYAPDRVPDNSQIAAIAADFVHLLCTSGLHGHVTLWPAPKMGVCQVCGRWFGIRAGMKGHQFSESGALLRARCSDHEDAGEPLHAITVQFPEAMPALLAALLDQVREAIEPTQRARQALESALARLNPC